MFFPAAALQPNDDHNAIGIPIRLNGSRVIKFG